MQIRDTIGTLIDRHRQALGQLVRFALVGVAATLLQYGVYLLLIRWMHPTLANTIAYVVSFLFNYVASVTFTFQVKSNMQRGAGFALAHAVNYTLQTVLLMLFLWVWQSNGPCCRCLPSVCRSTSCWCATS